MMYRCSIHLTPALRRCCYTQPLGYLYFERQNTTAKDPDCRSAAATAPKGSQSSLFDGLCNSEGRAIKSLTVVDDAPRETVAIVPERATRGHTLTRTLGSSGHVTRPPQSHPHGQWKGVLWSGHADLDSSAGVKHPSPSHAKVDIESRQREDNEERPKKGLGGLTPSTYTKQ